MSPEELVALIEERVIGPLLYTSDEVVGRGGTHLEEATELWQALGFGPVPGDAPVFTQADAEILAVISAVRDSAITTPEVILPMTRVLGQALSRVATAQVQVMERRLADALVEMGERGESELLESITEVLIPGFEHFISYVWRRHLAAALRREVLGETGGVRTVGFVDLVGFTAGTRDLDDAALSALLERFQRVVYEHVTAVGGRVVKVMGDGVMFDTSDAVAAAAASLGLASDAARDDLLPGVHVGLASGHLLGLEGDLFGETVNRASRLCDLARAHTVLVDDGTAQDLLAGGGWTLKRTRAHRLKGLGVVDTWVLRPTPRDVVSGASGASGSEERP